MERSRIRISVLHNLVFIVLGTAKIAEQSKPNHISLSLGETVTITVNHVFAMIKDI